MAHICVSKLIIIGSENGLSPGRRQANIWTNAGILLIGPPGTNFNEILNQENALENVVWKTAAILSRPQCVINQQSTSLALCKINPLVKVCFLSQGPLMRNPFHCYDVIMKHVIYTWWTDRICCLWITSYIVYCIYAWLRLVLLQTGSSLTRVMILRMSSAKLFNKHMPTFY